MSDLSVAQPDWDLLHKSNSEQKQAHLRELTNDGARCAKLVLNACGIELDASRDLISAGQLADLLQFGASADLGRGIDALLAGHAINSSENRAALHTALRAEVRPESSQEQALAQEGLDRMARLAHQLNSGEWAAPDGQKFTDLINIGIGGSDLGPRLICSALPASAQSPHVHFLSNLDGAAAHELMGRLNPATTAVQVTSKSFTTQETLSNAQTIRRWVESASGDRAGQHFMAVSTNLEAVKAFGIVPERTLPMWDWVGGRYSVWSTAGFAAAVGIGMAEFRDLLAGAAAMDEHFRTAPLAENLPVMLALLGVWYRNVKHANSMAVVPYTESLALLPAYLQQLEMESNGKSVRRDGVPVGAPTSPIVWGGTGTDVQHAFFQMLHQGSGLAPIQFIGVARPGHGLMDHHQKLLANLFAQAQALAWGRTQQEAEERLVQQGLSASDAQAQAPHRTYAGNKPSSMIMLDELSPRTLGSLLAMYEHKVFVQGWIWGINSFDQWGVELGKAMAGSILPALRDAEELADADYATRQAVARVRSKLG